MKIDIKPTIVFGCDYHEFISTQAALETFGIFNDYYELDFNSLLTYGYSAIFWPEGAEDELFEFIFTNQEAWTALTEEE